MMTRLALRNLVQSRVRLVISVGGVALALLLILALDAVMSGVQQQLTAYIDHSGADVAVSQRGVRNLHMASSSLPSQVAGEVRRVSGVSTVTPILYMSNMIAVGQKRQLAYVIGLPHDASMGTPWKDIQGRRVPGPGDAVIDAGVAAALGVGLGGHIEILGRPFRVAGLAGGTTTILNSIAFISLDDFSRLRGSADTVSFIWVKGTGGIPAQTLARRMQAALPGVTVQTRQGFAVQERSVINGMTTDIVTIMNLVGFFIGLAVVALTVYTATLSRRAEYGVLKAVGARDGYLYRVVLTQALSSVCLGLAVGIALTLLLAAIVPNIVLGLTLSMTPASVLKAGGMALVIAGLSALLPIRQIAGLDPATVFKGHAT